MMSTGSDEVVSNITPPTPVSSAALNPISHFLTQNQAAMGRYPIYAAALPTGNSLLCSPALLGQTVNPWRQTLAISSLSGSTNTAITTSTSGSSQQQHQQPSSQQQQLASSASPYMNLTQLAQLPGGLVCAPVGTFLPNMTPSSPQPESGKKTPAQEYSHKRRPESSHGEAEAHKRARLSEPSPQSPSLASSSSSSSSPHPNTPMPAFQPKQHSQQRSPVIKVIPYTPSQGAPLMIHTSPSSSLAQTIVFPSVNLSAGSTAQSSTVTTATTAVPSQQQQKVVNLQHLQPHLQQQKNLSSSQQSSFTSVHTTSGSSLEQTHSIKSHLGSAVMLGLPQAPSEASGGTNSTTTGATSLGSSHLLHPQQQQQYHHVQQQQQQQQQQHNQLVLPHATRHLLSGMRLVLLKCLGPVSECIVSQNHLVMSNFLQDLYRHSYFTTSNFSEPPLSPESCCLLTICYLSSLQRGEQISVEGLRTMIHHAQLGEMEWLNYYKKHKKMSESSFVQAQLIHLSRVAVYPVQGKVRVVISNQSLNEGVVMALQRLAQLWTSSEQNFPEYWVVLAVRPSSTIDFCVIVTDPLQVQLLLELKAMSSDARTKKQLQQYSSGRSQVASITPSLQSSSISSSLKVSISKDLLLAVQAFQERLGGGVLIPFYQQNSLQNRDSEDLLTGMGLVRMECEEADAFSPTSSHLVEHKARGPFQDQYNMAMHMLQKILSHWGSQAKIEEYQRVDFRVLCPPEASFVSQTMADIMDAGLVEHLKLRQQKGKKGTSDSKTSSTSSSSSSSSSGTCNAPLPSEVVGMSREVEGRVLCCRSSSSSDVARFHALLKEIEADTTTLYIVIAENGHVTNQVTSEMPSMGGPFSDDKQLLCRLSNCILVNVSSYPYSLQTNRSFVSFVNEFHWPISADKSSLHFCSSTDFRSNQFQNLESEFEYGVRFREDQCFEEMFHEVITNQAAAGGTHKSVGAIRLQLLLNQYTSALLGTVGKSSSASPSSPADTASPKTQDIINKLVLGPLGSPRGHGCMVIVRAHDKAIGKIFYQKIRQVRDALGLTYRFEVIYDDSSTFIKISEHFSQRLAQWKSGRHVNGVHTRPSGGGGRGGRAAGCIVTSYKELENLPCLVVLAGESRAGLSFPSTLRLVDLRLCYVVGTMTRLHYEYDTSFFNGYYKVQIKPTSPAPLSPEQQDLASKDKESTVVDSNETDVFDSASTNGITSSATSAGHFIHTLPTSAISGSQTGSTSSSRKSSYEEVPPDGKDAPLQPPPPLLSLSGGMGRQQNGSPTSAFGRPTVVEWRPEDCHSDEASLPSTPIDESEGQAVTSEGDTGKEDEAGEMVGVANPGGMKEEEEYINNVYSSTVTVTIDPPRDSGQGDENDPVYRYLGGGSSISSRSKDISGQRSSNKGSAAMDSRGDGETSMCESNADVWGKFCQGMEEEEGEGDLYESLNDLDMSEEDDSPPLVRLCLLSRQYYYIWCSRSAHQHLLLQPCPGVSWHGGQKRPPLFDQDPRQQSAHYRKWTKPGLKEVRNQYDGIMKMANKSSRRRFLLTGPPQVGKTGAWILMIKLLHDHLRSSLGVAVENPPPLTSLFMPTHPLDVPREGEQPTILCEENGVGEMDNHTSAMGTILSRTSRHSRIVPLEYLHHLFMRHDDECKSGKTLAMLRDTPTKSRSEASGCEITTSGSLRGYSSSNGGRHEVVSLPVSPYMSYDYTHSCNECSKYVRGTAVSPAEYLTSFLPCVSRGGARSSSGGESREGVTIKWRIPGSQQKHCIINPGSKTLERLKLPTVRLKGEKLSSQILTPVFTPTLGRDSCGLFNLFHGHFYNLHVLVTSETEFGNYCKAWPNHVVMALPDTVTIGLGSMYHYIKEFCQHNLRLNELANQHESHSRTLWPFVAILSDSVVMVKKLDGDVRSYVDISLSAALQMFEQSAECLQYVAMSALPWSKQLEHEQEEHGEMMTDGGEREMANHLSSSCAEPGVGSLTNYDLSHDFILLNLGKLAGTHYNQFSFNSAEMDFNLQLKTCQSRTKLCTDLVFVRKHLKTGGNPYPLKPDVSSLCQDVDKLVISLHHDTSSHLPHPGPYLMEHYLLYKSQALFPYAHSPHFPVLAIDNYISLGPHTYVSFIKSEMLVRSGNNRSLEQNGSIEEVSPSNQFALGGNGGHFMKAPLQVEDLSQIKFGGLLLYLCEEKLSREHLKGLSFVSGASLCLVTRDCKSLVKEVTRLDLEEKWKFRLRDEYQTACADNMTPLFFFIGRFEG